MSLFLEQIFGGGSFEIDTTTKVMRIRAEQLRVRQINTHIFLRDTEDGMSPLEKSTAPIDKRLSYQHTNFTQKTWWS